MSSDVCPQSSQPDPRALQANTAHLLPTLRQARPALTCAMRDLWPKTPKTMLSSTAVVPPPPPPPAAPLPARRISRDFAPPGPAPVNMAWQLGVRALAALHPPAERMLIMIVSAPTPSDLLHVGYNA